MKKKRSGTLADWEKRAYDPKTLHNQENVAKARPHMKDDCEWPNCDAETGLIPHHKNLNEEDNRPANIETLCKKHHALIHNGDKKLTKYRFTDKTAQAANKKKAAKKKGRA